MQQSEGRNTSLAGGEGERKTQYVRGRARSGGTCWSRPRKFGDSYSCAWKLAYLCVSVIQCGSDSRIMGQLGVTTVNSGRSLGPSLCLRVRSHLQLRARTSLFRTPICARSHRVKEKPHPNHAHAAHVHVQKRRLAATAVAARKLSFPSTTMVGTPT